MKSLVYVTSFQSVQAIWGEDKQASTHFLFCFLCLQNEFSKQTDV